jgi:hypothetical protein
MEEHMKDMVEMENDIRGVIETLTIISMDHYEKWSGLLDEDARIAAENVEQRLIAVNLAIAELRKAYLG